MKKLLPPMICLLAMAIPSSAQWVRKDESYDQEWSLQERARTAHINEPSGCELTTYPSRSADEGKGFYGGLAKVTVDGKSGFIDRAGNLVIKPRFDDAGRFSEGLAPVETGGKWGYINKDGKIVIPLTFDWALGFYEGRALIKVGERWGYVDTTGTVVIKPQFDEAGSFSEGLARVSVYDKDYKWGFIDRVGKNRWGFIDKSGDWVLKPVYDGANYDFQDGRATVSRDIGYKNGVVVSTITIDKRGQTYPEADYHESVEELEHLSPFSEGLAFFRLDGKYGYINEKRSVVITPQFRLVGRFSEGLAPVLIDGESHMRSWGFIDRRGKMVITPQFDWAWGFSEGRALVAVHDRVGYIDKSGRFIWKPTK